MFTNARTKSVFLSWLISYVITLLIPLGLNTAAYVESVRVVKEQIGTAHEASLHQLQQIVDEQLRTVEKFSHQIAFLDRVRSLLYLDSELLSFHRFYIYRLIQDFRVYKLASGIVDEFYVYFRRLDFGITSDAMYDTRRLYEFLHKDAAFSYYDWLGLVHGTHNARYLPITRRSSDGISVNAIALAQSIPYGKSGEKIATIVIMTDEENLRTLVLGLKWVSGGTVQIIDGSGSTVFSTGAGLPITAEQRRELKRLGTVAVEGPDGEDLILSAVESEVNDWTYVSILPDRVFMRASHYVGRIIVVSLALCVVVGIGVAYLFTRLNYNPLQKLLGLVPDADTKTRSRSGNEYDLLRSYVSDIIVENVRFKDRIDRQKEHLRNSFLVRLLRGTAQSAISLPDGLAAYGIEFAFPHFMVMLFTVDEADAPHESGNGGSSSEISRVLREEIRGEATLESGEIDGTVFCIVNMSQAGSSPLTDRLTELAESVQLQFEDEYGVSLSIARSDVHDSLHGIAAAYAEATAALEYKLLLGERTPVVSYSDIAVTDEGELSSTEFLQFELKFINCIKAEDYHEARIILDALFNEHFSSARLSLQMTKVRMFGLINTMVNAMSELTLHHEIRFLDSIDYAAGLLESGSVVELKHRMLEILTAVDEYATNRRQETKDHLKDEVMSYVREAYDDVDLNVSQIADRFGMSVSHLSRKFKKDAGVGLLDFIHKVRIDEAKRLLESAELTIGEIGRRVGYYSDVAFIRAFKRYEGVSPGKFRSVTEA